MITGFIKTVDINEFSKHVNINKNIKDQMEHVVWVCSCDEVNVDFKFRKGVNKFKCDSCHQKKIVEAVEGTKMIIDDEEIFEDK